ncbi:hypothetical protein LJB42_001796 [Komagataella kurtzmanii]|nr:hypothetical protein LJB42_001796 [Komagataella kurtzmanii]
MSDTQITAENELGQQLKSLVLKKLQSINFTDDPEYVSEFIVILISNNRSPDEITNELSSLFGDAINQQFVQSIFQDIQGLRSDAQIQHQQPQYQQQNGQEQVQLQQQQQPQQVISQAPTTNSLPPQSAFANIPDRPRSFATNNKRGRGGINKQNGRNNNARSNFALKNEENFLSAMDSTMNIAQPSNPDQEAEGSSFVSKKGNRCQYFPHCKNKQCPFGHPTKTCFAFPNCPNPAGTCNYLHPGEDDALIAELEKTRKEFQERKTFSQAKLMKQVERQVQEQLKKTLEQGQIGICKFGNMCSKEMCPFGHPTPANNAARVTVLEWCPEDKQCSNPECPKAHRSPEHKITEEEKQQKQQRALEQCRFGKSCRNYKCPRRHATTPVLCREGNSCTRPNCFFTHPIDEDCKFAAGCRNPNCPFKHPEGREISAGAPVTNAVWTPETGATSERQFAVPEDQIMEQVPLQN